MDKILEFDRLKDDAICILLQLVINVAVFCFLISSVNLELSGGPVDSIRIHRNCRAVM